MKDLLMISNLDKRHPSQRGEAMTQYQNSLNPISRISKWNSIPVDTLTKKKILTAFPIYRLVEMSQVKTKYKILQTLAKLKIRSHKSSKSSS